MHGRSIAIASQTRNMNRIQSLQYCWFARWHNLQLRALPLNIETSLLLFLLHLLSLQKKKYDMNFLYSEWNVMLLIFNIIYYFISQLHCISRLCIVAALKFIINQHHVFSIFVDFLITFHFFFLLFCLFFYLSVTFEEGEIQIYENYAIPSFAYVGSAYRFVSC